MAKPIPIRKAPDQAQFMQTNRAVILHYGLQRLGREMGSYAAIEQLIRLPMPQDDSEDSPPPLRVDRQDMCQLLMHVSDAIAKQVEFLTGLADEVRTDALGAPACDTTTTTTESTPS